MNHSNLDGVYETLKDWRTRFPNINCISVFLFEDEMRIRIDWKDRMSYTYVSPKNEMENVGNLDALGNMILSEAERKYRIRTVGEE